MKKTIKISAAPSWTDEEIIGDFTRNLPSYGNTSDKTVDEVEVTIILKRNVGKEEMLKNPPEEIKKPHNMHEGKTY